MATPSHHENATAGYQLMQNPATGDADYHIEIPPPLPTGSNQFPDVCRLIAIIAGAIIVIVIVLFALAASWSYVVVQLNDPSVPEFRVDSASLTWLNATGPNNLTATWDINLVVTNPNCKVNISYDTVSARVFYSENEELTLASTHLSPFSQEAHSETTLSLQFTVVDGFVNNLVANGIAVDRARGTVQFGVSFFAWISFIDSRHLGGLLKVDCDDVRFVFSPNNATGALTRGLQCDPMRKLIWIDQLRSRNPKSMY